MYIYIYIYKAAKSGSLACVRALLEARAKVEAKEEDRLNNNTHTTIYIYT